MYFLPLLSLILTINFLEIFIRIDLSDPTYFLVMFSLILTINFLELSFLIDT